MQLKHRTWTPVRSAVLAFAGGVSVIALVVVEGCARQREGAAALTDTGSATADAVEDGVDAAVLDVSADAPGVDTGPAVQDVLAEDAAVADAADGGDIFASDGDTQQTEETAILDVDAESTIDVGTADAADVHTVVAPPSSNQKCNCWPDGDDCDVFWDMVSWEIFDHPPCPSGEICDGDHNHSGWCRAACWHPELPDLNVGVQCDPSEYCFLGKLYNWEDVVIGQYAHCRSKP